MAKIFSYPARNELLAKTFAQTIEDAGGSVFSITSNIGPSGMCYIWAKYEPPLTSDCLERLIEAAEQDYYERAAGLD